MCFYRRDAIVLIPGWCNAIRGWDTTETQPVAHAGATRSAQLWMWVGPALGVTIPDAKKDQLESQLSSLLNTALAAGDRKTGKQEPTAHGRKCMVAG
jgi:hypothetical protein